MLVSKPLLALLPVNDADKVTGLVKAPVCDFCSALLLTVTLLDKVNVRNRHRETPLLLAVRASAADAVSVLLGFGAHLDDPDVNGETAIPLLAPCSPDRLFVFSSCDGVMFVARGMTNGKLSFVSSCACYPKNCVGVHTPGREATCS